jgi:hypothetical protein
MIKVIDTQSKPRVPVAGGHVRKILGPSEEGTRVEVAIEDVEAGRTHHLARTDRTQLAYVLEGADATIRHTSAGHTTESTMARRSGIYLEPGEEATISAATTPLVLLLVTVPKHTGKPTGVASPAGYVFEEAKLRSLLDEKRRGTCRSAACPTRRTRIHRVTSTMPRKAARSLRSISTSSRRAAVK